MSNRPFQDFYKAANDACARAGDSIHWQVGTCEVCGGAGEYTLARAAEGWRLLWHGCAPDNLCIDSVRPASTANWQALANTYNDLSGEERTAADLAWGFGRFAGIEHVAGPAAEEGCISVEDVAFLRKLQDTIHGAAVEAGWYTDLGTGAFRKRPFPEAVALIHSEITESFEGYRKNLMDEHLPDRRNMEVELADAVIRIFDTAGAEGMDLAGAIAEKFEYNKVREDHKLAVRAGGGAGAKLV